MVPIFIILLLVAAIIILVIRNLKRKKNDKLKEHSYIGKSNSIKIKVIRISDPIKKPERLLMISSPLIKNNKKLNKYESNKTGRPKKYMNGKGNIISGKN